MFNHILEIKTIEKDTIFNGKKQFWTRSPYKVSCILMGEGFILKGWLRVYGGAQAPFDPFKIRNFSYNMKLLAFLV